MIMTVTEVSLYAAAVLAVGLGLAHSVLGERYILVRLFRRDLPKLFGSDWFTKRTLRFAWHLTTIMAVGFGVLLWLVADRSAIDGRRLALLTIAATFAASAVLTAGFTRGRHLAWPVMTAIAYLVWIEAD